MFRKHRKGFSALQHLDRLDQPAPWPACWRADQRGEDSPYRPCLRVRSCSLLSLSKSSSTEPFWLQALANHGGAKAARQDGAGACYAWLYRHDRHWLMVANQVRQRRQGNNSHIDWRARDIRLVRLLIRLVEVAKKTWAFRAGVATGSCSSYPIGHQSTSVSINCLPAHPGFRAESVGEYQIRRLTAAMLKDVQTGITSRRWELKSVVDWKKQGGTTDHCVHSIDRKMD